MKVLLCSNTTYYYLPHFKPLKPFKIFLNTTHNNNMKIFISILYKHLQIFQQYNHYQQFIIQFRKYLLFTSYIHHIIFNHKQDLLHVLYNHSSISFYSIIPSFFNLSNLSNLQIIT